VLRVRFVLIVTLLTAQPFAPGALDDVDAVRVCAAYAAPRVCARLIASAALVLAALVDKRASRTDPRRQPALSLRSLCWHHDVVDAVLVRRV